ncbi:MAG: 16S rRNA (cytidine(1402)-2'-O)-methyltransferase [Saprospiraceae bacterium]|nr:16S rRNA (cytidine(1402)-2'-O)-methyltransferase [Saprospiraceae bacterium]
MLYVVPTPIGNLADITLRAIEILNLVDFVIAEDTRVSGHLLKHLEISKPLRSFHVNNEHRVVESITQQLVSGQNAALISDAGTPGISDPGYLLVKSCIEHDVEVQCLPGATAFVPALVVSGLPAHRFYFEGFLPHKKGRKTRLDYLAGLPDTFIIYESPHRVLKGLNELAEACGENRPACVCRELSKLHEEVARGSLTDLKTWANAKDKIKGEIVIVVGGKVDLK